MFMIGNSVFGGCLSDYDETEVALVCDICLHVIIQNEEEFQEAYTDADGVYHATCFYGQEPNV